MHEIFHRKTNWFERKIDEVESLQNVAINRNVKNWAVKHRSGKQITLTDDSKLTEFLSCSYLGLETHPQIIQAAQDSIAKWGVQFATARTRARIAEFDTFDDLLKIIFKGYHCVTFASVTLTHLGVLPLLASGKIPEYQMSTHGVDFYIDKSAHASIQINRGNLKEVASVFTADTQNILNLEVQFKTSFLNGRTPVLLCDGVGSMSGLAPIQKLVQLAEKYSGYIYVDDAHGISVLGENGCGYVLSCLENKAHPRVILVGSIGKGFGTHGGFIGLTTHEASQFIKKHAAPYVFGGPPPLCLISAGIASANIHLSDELQFLQKRYWNLIATFDLLIGKRALNGGTKSPVRGIYVGDEMEAVALGEYLRDQGFATNVVTYPAVKKNQALIRVSLSALHREEDVISLCKAITNFDFLNNSVAIEGHSNA